MLRTTNISVTYEGRVAALRPTSIAFEKGAFTVLVGTSGAGKSTLLRSLNGLVRPSTGDVERAGIGSIFASKAVLRAHRSTTGMIFQQHHLIGRLSVLDNVLMGRLSRHSGIRSVLPPARADMVAALSTIERVGLLDRALDRADKLSGGQQQRVGIARAMAQEPEIVLADEPIASLDPASAELVLSDLHRICREDGLTAIVSLHHVDFARRFADRIVGLRRGEVVFDGAPGQLGAAAVSAIYGLAAPPSAAAAE